MAVVAAVFLGRRKILRLYWAGLSLFFNKKTSFSVYFSYISGENSIDVILIYWL